MVYFPVFTVIDLISVIMCECNGSTFSDHDIFLNDKTCVPLVSINSSDSEICCSWTKFLELEGRMIICIIGITFNTIAIILLFDRKLSKEIFNMILISLVLMDNAYLLIGILEVWVNAMEKPTFDVLWFYFYFVRSLRGMIMCSIIYTTVILAYQRYMYVTRPLNSGMRNQQHVGATWKQVSKYVLPVISLSFAFELPVVFEVATKRYSKLDPNSLANGTSILLSEKTENNGGNDIITKLVVSELRSNNIYVLFYMNIANMVVTGIIPVLVLAFFNFFVIRGMRKFQGKRSLRRQESIHRDENKESQEDKELRNQRNQTIILLSIVIIFFVCHSLRIILNFHDLVTHKSMFQSSENDCRHGHPYWVNIAHPVSETFLKLNSVASFFIYCTFNNHFRKVAKKKFIKVFNVCGKGNCIATSSNAPCPRSRSSQDPKDSNTRETE